MAIFTRLGSLTRSMALLAVSAMLIVPLATLTAPMAAAATFNVSVSGGLSHTVGDALTIQTPDPGFAVEPFLCTVSGWINQPLAPDVVEASPSHFAASGPSVGGKCVWNVTLPNLQNMAYFPAGFTPNVTISVTASSKNPLDGSTVYLTTPNVTTTYARSSATPAPQSDLNVMFWTISPVMSSPGHTVTITPIPIVAAGYVMNQCSWSSNTDSGTVSSAHPGLAVSCPSSFNSMEVAPGSNASANFNVFPPFKFGDGSMGGLLMSANNAIWIEDPASIPALTVTANNVSRAYGDANPSFDATITGLIKGDDASVLSGSLVCSSTADAISPAGHYPITCSGISSNNYVINYVDGTLTIGSAPEPGSSHVVVLIDKSGSMVAKRGAAVNDYKAAVDELRDSVPNAYARISEFSQCGFNSLVTNRLVTSLPALTLRNYEPKHGCFSPIYDTVANQIKQAARNHPGEALTFVVITDGKDNRSVNWTKRSLDALIAQKQNLGWKFIFPMTTI